MPLYQYACSHCGNVIDKMLKISERTDEITQHCPECESEQTFNFNIGAPGISYLGVNHGGKIPSDLKYRLKQLRKMNPAMRSNY